MGDPGGDAALALEAAPVRVVARELPPEDLEHVVYGIYRNLGEWLLGKTEADIANRYMAIGAKRASQGVPLSQVIWVIALVKENLWEYLKQKNVMERPTEVFGELEMLQLLEQFFDRARFFFDAALNHFNYLDTSRRKRFFLK